MLAAKLRYVSLFLLYGRCLLKWRESVVSLPLTRRYWQSVQFFIVDTVDISVLGCIFVANHSHHHFPNVDHPNDHNLWLYYRIIPAPQVPQHCQSPLPRSELNRGCVVFLHLHLPSCLSGDHNRNLCATPRSLFLSSLGLCSWQDSTASRRPGLSPGFSTCGQGGPLLQKHNTPVIHSATTTFSVCICHSYKCPSRWLLRGVKCGHHFGDILHNLIERHCRMTSKCLNQRVRHIWVALKVEVGWVAKAFVRVWQSGF